ncbi:phage tail protein [Lachnospiraceae bacterium ZAX-1]
MGNERLYFTFNKKQDYQRGYLEHMDCGENGIRAGKDSVLKAAFISRILDSRETQTQWHRLTLEGAEEVHSPYKISIYASDQTDTVYQGDVIALDQIMHHPDISIEEKLRIMEPYLQKTAIGASDLLLHEVEGRYLWIAIEMYRQEGRQLTLNNIMIYFPRQSWISYLPGIYQKSDGTSGFLERYLGIFQTLHEDLNEEIRQSAKYFDVESADMEILSWLAQWLGIRESYMWSKQQLRKLLKKAVSLYKRRGTRQAVLEFVALYTGEMPYMVENFQIREFYKKEAYYEQLVKLYGDEPNIFLLIIKDEQIPSVRHYKMLVKMIEEVKPAHMDLNMIIIKPFIFLNGYSYLGINSVLGNYETAALNEQAMLSFTKVGDRI